MVNLQSLEQPHGSLLGRCLREAGKLPVTKNNSLHLHTPTCPKCGHTCCVSTDRNPLSSSGCNPHFCSMWKPRHGDIVPCPPSHSKAEHSLNLNQASHAPASTLRFHLGCGLSNHCWGLFLEIPTGRSWASCDWQIATAREVT